MAETVGMSGFRKKWIGVTTIVGLAAITASCGGGGGTGGGSTACSAISLGQGASLNGFRPFTAANLWNKDVSGAAVDPNSAAIINFIGGSTGLHADFGSGQYQGSNIGIP